MAVQTNMVVIGPDNIVVCRSHALELQAPLAIDQTIYDFAVCILCSTRPVYDRRCYREECNKPLHPRWPAVYCSNACAIDDA